MAGLVAAVLFRASGQEPHAVTRAAQSDFSSWTQSDGPHAVYEAETQHVNQLWYDSTGWHGQDLTTLVQGPLSAPLTAFTSFIASDGPHTIYVDSNQHVNQVWYDSKGWHGQDLIADVGAPVASVTSGFTSWIGSDGPHAVYVDPNQRSIASFNQAQAGIKTPEPNRALLSVF